MTRRAAITGLGTCLPPRVVTNDDLARTLDTDDAWIRSRTGIAARRRADPGTATSDLAVAAGVAALRSADTQHAGMLLLATTTPDHPCPATAPAVAARLGLAGIPAFDIGAVCSGFLYALATADAFIRAGSADSALVIGAETYSTILDPADRETAVIFGDGAGAVLLCAAPDDAPGTILATDLGSDGACARLITVEAGGSRLPWRSELSAAERSFRMQGRAVYAHAVRHMTATARTVLDRTGWKPADVDAFVGHQANQRILDAVADRLGIPRERGFGNIRDVGNTAAASIPLALAATLDAVNCPTPGTPTLLTAFGGGLTWGAATLRWPDVRPCHRPPSETPGDEPVPP